VSNGQSIVLSASVGLAVLDRTSESAAAVLAIADKACYAAKNAAKEAAGGGSALT